MLKLSHVAILLSNQQKRYCHLGGTSVATKIKSKKLGCTAAMKIKLLSSKDNKKRFGNKYHNYKFDKYLLIVKSYLVIMWKDVSSPKSR